LNISPSASCGDRADVSSLLASNQALIAGVVCAEFEPPVIKEVVHEAKAKTQTDEDAIEYALDMIVRTHAH